MRRSRKTLPVFVIFFFLSLLIFIFSLRGFANGFTGILESITLPIQRSSFLFFHSNLARDGKSEIEKLKKENRDLRIKTAKVDALERDNQALRDQFAVANPKSKNLLPAFIVGMPAFLPGISQIDEVIIDKGSGDKVKAGDSIVFKDNLIGQAVKVSPHLSVVYLLNHKGISFTAKATETSALGIIKGTGGDTIVFDNVLLSDTLQKGDIVVTKGDIQSDGSGFPPDLVIGKIISINRKASALFQSAEVESLTDVTKLETVFVVIGD